MKADSNGTDPNDADKRRFVLSTDDVHAPRYHLLMELFVNGEHTTVSDVRTVADLLARRGLVDRPCAVEVNRALVPKSKHDRTSLSDGDRVEIVTLVGGG